MAAQKFSGIWNFKSSAKTFGDYLRASGEWRVLIIKTKNCSGNFLHHHSGVRRIFQWEGGFSDVTS